MDRHVKSKKGIGMVEYMLLFAAVITVLMIVMAPNGRVPAALNFTIDQSFRGVECITQTACVSGVGTCPSATCGNGCCEPTESTATCPGDCG